jgi:DNA-binding MarR family transcriptional regulator
MSRSITPGVTSVEAADLVGRHHRGDEPHLLRELVRAYQTLVAVFARRTGMPAARFGLLRLLAVTEGDRGVMDLARQLGVNPAAVTRQVQELEREGLVRRRADRRDRRRSHVDLSPKGRRVFAEIHARTHELERSLVAVLGEEEMRRAARVLGRLRVAVEGSVAGPGEGRR